MIRRPVSLALLCGILTLGFALAADSHAGEGADKKGAAKTAKAKKAEAARAKEHLPFKRSYADALLEARIRNLPVFVSRHKDF